MNNRVQLHVLLQLYYKTIIQATDCGMNTALNINGVLILGLCSDLLTIFKLHYKTEQNKKLSTAENLTVQCICLYCLKLAHFCEQCFNAEFNGKLKSNQ